MSNDNFIYPPGANLDSPTPAPTPAPVEQPVTPPAAPESAPASVETPPTAPAPATPADTIDEGTILRALGMASDGKVTTLDDFKAALQAREQAAQLQARMAELESAPKVEFASPLVQKLNEMAALGASLEEQALFLQYQKLDPQTMPPIDAIRMAVKADNPTWDDAMVDAHLSHNLHLASFIEEGAEASPLDKVHLANAQKNAVERLNALKVQVETPASIETKRQTQQQQQAVQQQYAAVSRTVVQQMPALQVGAGEDAFSFPVAPELQQAGEQFLASMGLQGAWQHSEANAATAQQLLRGFYLQVLGDQFLNAYSKHVADSTRARVVKEHAGQPPAAPAVPGPAPAPKPSGNPRPGDLIM